MKFKSDVTNIFSIFKNKVKNLLGEKMVTLFSDEEGEYIGLAKYLSQNGITNLTSQPHTPEHNGIPERK